MRRLYSQEERDVYVGVEEETWGTFLLEGTGCLCLFVELRRVDGPDVYNVAGDSRQNGLDVWDVVAG